MSITALDDHFRAQRLESLQVQVIGRAPITQPPGSDTLAFFSRPKSGPSRRSSPHLPDQIVVSGTLDLAGLHVEGVALEAYLCSQPGENLAHELHVAEVRHAPDQAGLVVSRVAAMIGSTASSRR